VTPAAAQQRPPTVTSDLEEDPAWSGLFDEQPREQPAPLLPATPLTRPPGTQTRTVLILVGIFVIIMLALAKCGLSGLGDNAFVDRPRSSGTATSSPSATGTGTASGTETTPTETPSPAGPVTIAGVQSFDPEGDGEEKESLSAKAIDGDPGTDWTSDAYKSASFSGLKKGVGLRLDLGSATEVHEVKVTVPTSGTNLELRTMDGDSLDDTKVVATADDLDGTVTLTPSSPVKARYLLLWFTKATEDEDGYRVAVSEVTVQ
jgi:hypothetical protein